MSGAISLSDKLKRNKNLWFCFFITFYLPIFLVEMTLILSKTTTLEGRLHWEKVTDPKTLSKLYDKKGFKVNVSMAQA